MSKWAELGMEEKIIGILSEVPDAEAKHHFGRAFVTAYQLAIEFARRHPTETRYLGLPIGGVGTGQRNSLAQYIAGRLSQLIKARNLLEVEGGYLSNQHLRDITFKGAEGFVRSSLTGSGYALSMFRLRD